MIRGARPAASQQLLQVERVAAALPMQPLARRRPDTGHQLTHDLNRQRAQLEHLRGPALLRRRQRRLEPRRPPGPCRQRQQHARPRRAATAAAPARRPTPGPPNARHPATAPAGARPPRAPTARAPPAPLGDARPTPARRPTRPPAAPPPALAAASPPAPRAPGQPALAYQRLERVLQQRERQINLELGRTALQHQQLALPRPLGQLGQQPRLPDPRLAPQRHRTRGSVPDCRERSLQRRQLVTAPHQNGRPLGHVSAYPATSPRFTTAAWCVMRQKHDDLIGTSARARATSSCCLTIRAGSGFPSRTRHSW